MLNSLPSEVLNSKTVMEFKTKLDKLWINRRQDLTRYKNLNLESTFEIYNSARQDHTGPSINTGTKNTIHVLKFKCIGFKKYGGF